MKYLLLALTLFGCAGPIVRDNDKEERERQERRERRFDTRNR